MAFTVKQLIGNKGKPVTVYDTDLVTKAQELMVKNKFSQLPVIDKHGKALGLITSDSLHINTEAIYHKGAITDSAEELSGLREWVVGTMVQFQRVIEQYVGEIVLVEELRL